ncbi:MAG: hypothetical protein M2R45_00811 [Verrucomicrobia subdivision 3 bacterium]|nr:hypothetical protein [Limisphaerales bacterium]MCS1413083.1 hypothetical protein [Limisphaerales bacterium]
MRAVIVHLPGNESVLLGTEGNQDAASPIDGDNPNQELIDSARGADVAIMDAQYDATE